MRRYWNRIFAVISILTITGCGGSAGLKAEPETAVQPAEKGFLLGGSDMTVYYGKAYRKLAAETAGYLQKIYGKQYPQKEFTAADRDKPGIFIGIRPKGTKIDVSEDREFCVRQVSASQLHLFGNQNTKLAGTVFAVYDFLEKECDVRWLWPGELGTVAESRPPKRLKNGTSIFVPAFERRMTNSFTYGLQGMPAKERGDLNLWLNHQKAGSSLLAVSSGFQHAFASLMPRQKYGREHPEYYSLVSPAQWIGDPKPDKPTRRNDWTRHGSWQLCTSNPEVRRIIAEKIAAPKDGKIRSISPNDGNGFCECPACMKQDGKRAWPDMTNRMYDFAEDVAKQVHRINPGAKVGMFAYSFYAGVPDRKIAFPGNTYLSFCYTVMFMNPEMEKQLEKHLEGLAATGGRVIGREYWGCHYTMNYPLSHSRKIDRNLKLLHRLRAAGIYGETGKDFAARATDLYILMKLSWDPTLKREDILHDFCDHAFGPKAGPVMYELFEKIEDWVEKTTCHFEDYRGPNFQHYRNGYAARNRAMADCFNQEFQKMCEGYYRKALKLAGTPERKARIAFIQSGTRMAQLTTDTINAYADLAAAGINMPLTQPSGKEIRMEKKNLQKLVGAVWKAAMKKNSYFGQVKHNNAFGGSVLASHTRLELRPWIILAEKAKLDLSADRFNYLVNGAFEYNGYSWDMSGSNGAVIATTRECNHDADNNYMVQCHAGQGLGLQVALPAGGSAELVNRRKISPDRSQRVNLRLFAKCEGDPMDRMTVEFAGRKLEGVVLPAEVQDESGWQEIRFKPITVPAGEHVFRISFRNAGGTPVKLYLDDLVLRMKDVR